MSVRLFQLPPMGLHYGTDHCPFRNPGEMAWSLVNDALVCMEPHSSSILWVAAEKTPRPTSVTRQEQFGLTVTTEIHADPPVAYGTFMSPLSCTVAVDKEGELMPWHVTYHAIPENSPKQEALEAWDGFKFHLLAADNFVRELLPLEPPANVLKAVSDYILKHNELVGKRKEAIGVVYVEKQPQEESKEPAKQ